MACEYIIKDNNGNDVVFKDKPSLIKYIKDNKLYEGKERKGIPVRNTEALANVLRQVNFGELNYSPKELLKFQEELLDNFIALEEESQYFYKIGAPLSLTKGFGKSFDTIDGIKRNIKDLSDIEKAPFDVRYLITGDSKFKPENATPYYHNITANNVKIMTELDALSSVMFMERTGAFKNTTDKVVANLKSNIVTIPDKISEMKDELSAFVQIAAYKQWIKINDKETSTLRYGLIYDSKDGIAPTIVDIVRQAYELAPANTFLQFILPVPTTVKIGKKKQKNITNRDLINTIEGKTRGRVEPDLIASMMDSFTELYQNPKTQFHAKALFDYLIVKDGLMFKNKSFIKMLPTILFNEMSSATEIATKVMSANSRGEFIRLIKELAATNIINQEGIQIDYFTPVEKQSFNEMLSRNDISAVKNALFNKIFGLGYNELYDKFESIYGTDIGNQFNLELITPTPRTKGSPKQIDAITIVNDGDKTYMHVNMFTNKFKATEKGSEERKKIFKDTLFGLGNAGFFTSEVGEDSDKVYIEFKKYIRVRNTNKTYSTQKLVSITRDGKTYEGASMTAEGELVPRGTYGVYEVVDAVGTPNSTGMADLSARPTKDQVIRAVNAKIARRETIKPQLTPQQTQTSITPGVPTAPQPSESTQGDKITGGIFGGLQQLPSSGEDFNNMPLDFFTDDQVDQNPC